MTEVRSCSLGEVFHEEALLPVSESTPRTLIPVWTLPLRVVWTWPDPLPTRMKRVGKKCTDRMVGGARSIALDDACTSLLPS